MLVLSREIDEVIMIGDDVEVKVVDIRGDKVRLGFTAPRQVPIHRKEVFDAIEADKGKMLVRCSSCHRELQVERIPGEVCVFRCSMCDALMFPVPLSELQKKGT